MVQKVGAAYALKERHLMKISKKEKRARRLRTAAYRVVSEATHPVPRYKALPRVTRKALKAVRKDLGIVIGGGQTPNLIKRARRLARRLAQTACVPRG